MIGPMNALVAGLIAGYAIAIPVGAVAVYLVSLTARTTLRTGVVAALGVATVDGLYAAVAVAGGGALAHLVTSVSTPLRWASAAVLILIAAHGAATALRRRHTRPAAIGQPPADVMSPLRAYTTLVGLTALNPTTVVYFAALVVGGSARVAATPADAAVFVGAAAVASASWQLLLAGGGAALGRVLTGDRGRLATALVSSGVITALAVYVALSG